MAEEGFGTVAEELRQNRLEQRRANALTEKILEDRYKDDLPAERIKDNLFEVINDRLLNAQLMTRITNESEDVEDLNKSSNKYLVFQSNLMLKHFQMVGVFQTELINFLVQISNRMPMAFTDSLGRPFKDLTKGFREGTGEFAGLLTK